MLFNLKTKISSDLNTPATLFLTRGSAKNLLRNVNNHFESKVERALMATARDTKAYMRRSMPSGTTSARSNRYNNNRVTNNYRSRSSAGRPPHAHTANGLKNIRINKKGSKIYISPVKKTSRSGRYSYDLIEMLEYGGVGRVLMPKRFAEDATKPFNTRKTNREAWPMIWVNAKYEARPFLRPAALRASKKFSQFYRGMK